MINAVKQYSSGNVHIEYSDNITAAQVFASKDILAGEPIKLGYRPDFTNTNYLRYYGFIFENSSEITYVLEFNLTKNDPLLSEKLDIFIKMPYVGIYNQTIIVPIQNTTNPENLIPLLSSVRLAVCDNRTDLDKIKEYFLKYQINFGILSLQNEIQAHKFLKQILQNTLKSYKTTIQVFSEH